MSAHDLKILPEFFRAVVDGRKRFEIRKNDRNFAEGDALILREFDGLIFTGRHLQCRVTYRTTFEQKPGFVVLGIELSEA